MTSSISLVMALKNNQTVATVAHLVRFADAEVVSALWVASVNSACVRSAGTADWRCARQTGVLSKIKRIRRNN